MHSWVAECNLFSMFIYSLGMSVLPLMHASTIFFSQPKQCLNVSPLVAAIQSTQTLARRHLPVGRSVLLRLLARLISLGFHQGQCWECIKTVKMATVTGSWHSLYLGMMSTFDILQPCPKIIIPQLNSIASCCSPLVMNILHPPTFQSTHDFHLSLLSLSGYSFISSLSLQPTIHPAILILFLSVSPQCNQPSSLFSAESDLFSYSHNPGIIYLLFTHSLFPFSSSLPIYLSIRQLFLRSVNLFQSSTPLNASVFPPWLHFSSIHPCPSVSLLLAFPLSSFHSFSDVRQSQGVNSSFIRSLWNLWCWKDELDWRLPHSA